MKLLNDLFSLLSGTGKKDNLKDMIEDNLLRVILALLTLLVVFVGFIIIIVVSII